MSVHASKQIKQFGCIIPKINLKNNPKAKGERAEQRYGQNHHAMAAERTPATATSILESIPRMAAPPVLEGVFVDDAAGVEAGLLEAVNLLLAGGEATGVLGVFPAPAPGVLDPEGPPAEGVVGLVALKLGAGVALVGSTRAPTPHGMGSFEPGWVALAGGVVCPVGDAIVKRVTQVLTAV